MGRAVYLVYPDTTGWVVRPFEQPTGTSLRFPTREQALLGARTFAGESAAARVVLFKATGIVEIDYDA